MQDQDLYNLIGIIQRLSKIKSGDMLPTASTGLFSSMKHAPGCKVLDEGLGPSRQPQRFVSNAGVANITDLLSYAEPRASWRLIRSCIRGVLDSKLVRAALPPVPYQQPEVRDPD